MDEKSRNRKIVVYNFNGEGKHLYEDELGWTINEEKEVGSLVSKRIFDFEVVDVGLNLSFYYVDNDTFYGIHRERYLIECKYCQGIDLRSTFIGNVTATLTIEVRSLLGSMTNMRHGIISKLMVNP